VTNQQQFHSDNLARIIGATRPQPDGRPAVLPKTSLASAQTDARQLEAGRFGTDQIVVVDTTHWASDDGRSAQTYSVT